MTMLMHDTFNLLAVPFIESVCMLQPFGIREVGFRTMDPLQAALFCSMIAMTFFTAQVEIMKIPATRAAPTLTAATLATPTLTATTPIAATTVSTT